MSHCFFVCAFVFWCCDYPCTNAKNIVFFLFCLLLLCYDCTQFVRCKLLLLTVICILSVDFTIFPRRLAKAEYYGIGLMDTGVGAFIFCLGLTTNITKNNAKRKIKLKNDSKSTKNKQSSIYYYYYTFANVLPLFILGIIRMISIIAVDYHSHVSEYGIHWNFWFTMFVVAFLSEIIDISNNLYIPLILTILYQIFLSTPILQPILPLVEINDENISQNEHYDLYQTRTELNEYHNMHEFSINHHNTNDSKEFLILHNLTDYIFFSSRVTFFSMNKEGIMSIMGFFILFNLGKYISKLTTNNVGTSNNIAVNSKSSPLRKYHLLKDIIIFRLIPLAIISLMLAIVCHYFVQNISRRLCNMAYVCYLFSFNVFAVIFSFFVTDFVFFYPTNSIIIYQIIDTNQFFIFLFANLMTGLINILLKTLFATPFVALFVIVVYVFIVIVAGYVLRLYSIRVKMTVMLEFLAKCFRKT